MANGTNSYLSQEFGPQNRAGIVVGRYRISGKSREEGYFLDILNKGTVLIPFPRGANRNDILQTLVPEIRESTSFEYYEGGKEVKNLKEGWGIEYTRLEFAEMAELEKLLD